MEWGEEGVAEENEEQWGRLEVGLCLGQEADLRTDEEHRGPDNTSRIGMSQRAQMPDTGIQ